MAESDKFERTETIVLPATIKTGSTGDLKSPATSVKIFVYDPLGTEQVSSTSMTEASAGIFVYNYTTLSTDVCGVWRYRVIGLDGSDRSLGDFYFTLIS